MDLRKRRKHSVEKLPIGTIRVRQQRRADGSRFKVRVIKVTHRGRGDQKWKNYARWLWERDHGPVPAGKRVLHRDGDTMNDDPANLMLGTAADVVYLFCHADPQKSADNFRKARAACAQHNRLRAQQRRACEILPSKWYAVDLGKQVIINDPHRKRRSLFGGQGRANGQGWQGWALGWPDLSGTEAFICATLDNNAPRGLGEIRQDVSIRRERYQLPGIETVNAIASAICSLCKRGFVVRCGRGTYRIGQAALDARGPVFPYVAVFGEELLEDEQYREFKLVDPKTGRRCKLAQKASEPRKIRKDTERMKVAQMLLAGPRKPEEISQACEIRSDKLNGVLTCPWFAPHGQGLWRITTVGRSAVTGKQVVP